jgi:Protein of unknown function (DUF1214)
VHAADRPSVRLWRGSAVNGRSPDRSLPAKDAKGDLLGGDDNYKLHVPPNVPAKQFWALTLYDRETCGFIREMPRAGVDS